MKIIASSLLWCTLGSLTGAIAQDVKPAAPDWENPRVFGINKEPGRATFTPFPSEEAALADKGASSFVESLNGTWKFNWVKSPELRPADFYKPDFDVSSWKEIPVPSNCFMEADGTPIFPEGYTGFDDDAPPAAP